MGAFEIAVEDCREHHAALVQLIRAKETQAVSLMSFYATLAVAMVTAASASFTPKPLLPPVAGAALIAATLTLLIGAFFCLKVLRTTTVGLPGREPDFWVWAVATDEKIIISKYLEGLRDNLKEDERLNKRLAIWMDAARKCALVMPFSAAAGAFFYLLIIGLSSLRS